MLHAEPNITWKDLEARSIIIQQKLQYTIIRKFSYGKPNIKKLRKVYRASVGSRENAQ